MEESLPGCIQRHLQSNQILAQLLDSLRTQILAAVDAKQERNQVFISSLSSAIDYLELNIKSKKDILENTVEEDDEDEDQDED
ncbi:hypothetical protein L1887_34435 [Cichorium endivia]|nr:hypothetical protein L1887_34435 [Cichorium endivia]